MEDIAPALLAKIREDFLRLLGDAKVTTMTYEGAREYSEAVGEALAQAFALHISVDKLPEGRMFWNIADRVIHPMLVDDYTLVADAAAIVQQELNNASGLGLRAQRADLDEDKIAGILNSVASAQKFEDVAWMLDEPVKTFSRGVVDDTLHKNIDFQGKAGLRPRVIRTAERRCCKWCSNLDGVYNYPDIPPEVYQRHRACRCNVEYDPGDNIRRQDVWSKRWI